MEFIIKICEFSIGGKYAQPVMSKIVARDDPTRTCCGPCHHGSPKLKHWRKEKNIDFSFENQN
jgi:hypothetical protein